MSKLDDIYVTERSDALIAKLEAWCYEVSDKGTTHYPSMTYEQGIMACLDWLTGYTDDNPNGFDEDCDEEPMPRSGHTPS